MRRKLNKHAMVLLLCGILLLQAAAGATLAYLITGTDPVENIFAPSRVSCAVVENDTAYTGSQVAVPGNTAVRVQNTGDVAAYIRAAIVVTWKNKDGNVLAAAPVLSADGTSGDYIVSIPADTAWKLGTDGFYYYTTPVAPTQMTDVLMESYQDLGNAPDGYFFSVEIMASAIQSEPANLVKDVWPVAPILNAD